MDAQDKTWSDYVSMLRRRWRPTFIATAVVALGSIYIAYSLPAVYESGATILIEQQGIPTDYVQTTVNTYAEERLQTIYQRVLAAPNVAELIDEFNLYPEERGSVPEDELVTLFRDSTLMEPQNVTTVHARTGREAIVTFGFRVAFQYPEPEKARDVAREISNHFVTYNSALRTEAATRTTEFLDSEAARIEDRLADVASRIAEFKEQHAGNLPEDRGVNQATWERLREDRTAVENQLRDARERKALLETELAETPRYRPVLDGSGDPVLGGIDRLAEAQQELIRLRSRYSEDHPQIVNLRREVAALSSSPENVATAVQQLRTELEVRRKELTAAKESYSENHPDVIRLQRNVESLEQQVREMEAQVASMGPAQPNNPLYLQLRTRIQSADSEIADLMRRREDLSARIDDLERRARTAPQVEREFASLQHEQEVLLVRYRELRGLEGEAALGEALETGQSGERLTIVEPARIPASPVSPNRISLSFLGIVLAIAIGVGVASLTEAADTRVRGQRDVYQLLDMPPIGIIPYVEDDRDRAKRRTFNTAMGTAFVGAVAFVVMTVMTA